MEIMKFSELHKDDLDATIKELIEVFGDIDEESFKDLYHELDSEYCYIPIVDDIAVGYLIIEFFDNSAHVIDIAIHKDYRGKGLAKALFKHLLKELDNEEDEYSHLTLEVDCTNTNAMILYLHFGFIPVGFISGYYENGNDALYMRYNIKEGMD